MSAAQIKTITVPELINLKNVATGAATRLKQSEAARRYADYLIKESYCIDMRAYPYKAIHLDSGNIGIIDIFRAKFPAWAKQENIRVATDEYADFLSGLVDRLVHLLPLVHGFGFNPAEGQIYEVCKGILVANTYIPFRPVLTGKFVMPAILQEYINRMFPDVQDQKIVIQFLAHIIQHPEIRPQWGIVNHGDNGTGKSLLYELVVLALGGNHHWDENNFNPIDEKFSEILVDSLICHFDDAPVGKLTYQKLKHAITRTTKQISVKSVQKRYKSKVYARFMVSFNLTGDPLLHELGCRRLYYTKEIKHKNNNPIESAEFFDKFAEFLKQPNISELLYHFFMSIDLSDFELGHCIKTETYYKMTSSDVTTVLDDLLKQYTKSSSIFHIKTLYEYLNQNGITYPERQLDQIKTKLDKLGYESTFRPVDKCGKNVPLWQPKAKRSRPLYAEEIKTVQHALGVVF